ncbi:hypothetical protein [Paenibacillus sp. J2TS4]|nr:hypothetical protein [Paenibacillus sp. J2TS4]
MLVNIQAELEKNLWMLRAFLS